MTQDFHFSRPRESDVEDEVIAWAMNNGFEHRFMAYRGRQGCPDSWFFINGFILPIEFKKPGGPNRANQVQDRKKLAKVGVIVPVFDNAQEAIRYLRSYLYRQAQHLV